MHYGHIHVCKHIWREKPKEKVSEQFFVSFSSGTLNIPFSIKLCYFSSWEFIKELLGAFSEFNHYHNYSIENENVKPAFTMYCMVRECFHIFPYLIAFGHLALSPLYGRVDRYLKVKRFTQVVEWVKDAAMKAIISVKKWWGIFWFHSWVFLLGNLEDLPGRASLIEWGCFLYDTGPSVLPFNLIDPINVH